VPDPAKISGNGGRFDLSDQRGTIFIDPAPHDRKFYLKHMEALANYLDAMSYGQLRVEWEVFPLDNDSAYVLPDAGTYNPAGQVGTWEWENLETFFGDAIRAADADDDLVFSDFDAFVIIHAGSDWQNDLRGDSPYDLPSFFITLAESVVVDGGAAVVVDGSVVPETSSQDGYLNGINAVLAHEIGHQLGLMDLYDTYTGLSVVGYWDLMDFGTGVGVVLADPRTEELYYVTGIIPSSMSVFNRMLLGWMAPDTVRTGGTYSLRAQELRGEFPNRQALMVPLNSYEYLLIENRQCDLDGDSTGIVLSDPGPDSTGVIMGPVNQDREFNYEYDWPLPGSGLLVWHVDQVMVDFGFPFDAINYFPQRRGVTIIEADGIPDLGDYNSFYFLGSPFDPFYRGNNDRLADDTYPNSRSATGCRSHVVVDQIGEPGNVMDLRVSYAWRKDGFPLALGDSLRFGVPSLLVADLDGPPDTADEVVAVLERALYSTDTLGVLHLDYYPAMVYGLDYAVPGGSGPIDGWPRRLHGSRPTELVGADLDGDGALEIVAGDETGRLYAFTRDGRSYFESADSLGAFVRLDEGINGVPVACDLDGDGREEILVGSFGLQVLESDPGSGRPRIWTLANSLSASQPLVVDYLPGEPGDEVVFFSSGYIHVISSGGQPLISPLAVNAGEGGSGVYLAAGDLDRAGEPGQDRFQLVLAAADGRVWVVRAGGDPVAGWGRVCDGLEGPPALADVDGDGYLEVILTDTSSKTRVLTRTGARLEGWPRPWTGCSLPLWDYDFFIADTTIDVPSAVVADFDCRGSVGVFQGSIYECIVGWGAGGELADGLPLSLGGGCSALALGDIDGDGASDLVAGGGDGRLYSFSHPACSGGSPAPPWAAAYFDRTRNCVFPSENLPPMPEPGIRLLVAGSFHAFPNPVTGGAVTFVVESETGGRADLEIFDLSGARVKAVTFDALAKTENTVDVGDLGNGLYLCRLDISGGGRRASEYFKMAIKR